MPKTREDPSLFTRFARGFVRFLALTSTLPTVGGIQILNEQGNGQQLAKSNKLDLSDLYIQPGLEIPGGGSSPTWEDIIQYQISNAYVGSSGQIFDYVSELLAVAESQADEINLAIGIMQIFNERFARSRLNDSAGYTIEVPKHGKKFLYSFKAGKTKKFFESELFSIAVAAAEVISDKLKKPSGLMKINEFKLHSADFIDGAYTPCITLFEYFLNTGYHFYHEEQLLKNTDNPNFDAAPSIEFMTRTTINMAAFQHAIDRANPPEVTKHLTKLLKQSHLMYRELLFRESGLHLVGQRLEQSSDSWFFEESAEDHFGEDRKVIMDEYKNLHVRYSHGKINIEEFKNEIIKLHRKKDKLIDKINILKWVGLINPFYYTSKVIGLLVVLLSVRNFLTSREIYNYIRARREVPAAVGSIDEVSNKHKKAEEKRIKHEERKKLEQANSDPEATAEAEELRQKELQDYAKQQAQLRAEREANERMQAEERKKIKAAQEERDKEVELQFNKIYGMLSNFTSDKGKVKILFKGGAGLRTLTLNKIQESGANYFLGETHEVDQKLLAKDILIKLGLDKSSELYVDLHKQFSDGYDNGPDAIRIRKAQALAEAIRLAELEAELRAQEARLAAEEAAREDEERMNINKKLYLMEKERSKKPVLSLASSSSSSSVPSIGFASKEEAEKVKALIAELVGHVKTYQSPETISTDLFELKHDLIKIAAITEQLANRGGRLIVNALLNYPVLKVIRNGALHLLEIDAHENMQVNFYQEILLQLGTIALLNIDEVKLSRGLNNLLNFIRNEQGPVEFSAQISHEIYQSFQADSEAWNHDHDTKARSNVIEDIETRKQLLEQSDPANQKRQTMIRAEIGELYNQLKNTGVKIPKFAHPMIKAKNEFAHEGKAIEVGKIKVALNK